MSMTYAQSLTILNTILGDTGDVTFTPEEKQQAMNRAWNDSYVVQTVWDESTTYSSTSYDYPIPSVMTTVKDIYLTRSSSSDDFPEPIDSDLWEIVNGNIHFSSRTNSVIPSGHSIYIKGNYKYTTADTIDNTRIEEYVLDLAGVNTLRLLGFKKANLFLKNDTTMGELIALKRELEQDVKNGRLMLAKEYENA